VGVFRKRHRLFEKGMKRGEKYGSGRKKGVGQENVKRKGETESRDVIATPPKEREEAHTLTPDPQNRYV